MKFNSIDILRESGIASELQKRTLFPNTTLSLMNSDLSDNDYQYEAILTSHLYGTFILHLIGIFLSLFCLISEHLIFIMPKFV